MDDVVKLYDKEFKDDDEKEIQETITGRKLDEQLRIKDYYEALSKWVPEDDIEFELLVNIVCSVKGFINLTFAR